jgi:hypothetical protein
MFASLDRQTIMMGVLAILVLAVFYLYKEIQKIKESPVTVSQCPMMVKTKPKAPVSVQEAEEEVDEPSE